MFVSDVNHQVFQVRFSTMDEIPEHISNTSAPVRVIRQDLVYGKSSLTPSKYNYNKGYLEQNYIIYVRKYAF